MTLAGFPTARELDGISLVTILPEPMMTLSPIETPGLMMAPHPIHTSLPMVTGVAYSKSLERSFLSWG